MAVVEMELDLPEGTELCGYERVEDGHVFEVQWPLPEESTCQKCGRRQPVRLQFARKMQVVRDLDIWGQPSFFVYQAPYHHCGYCRHQQWLLPPFRRANVTYTYRFEEQVLRMLIGSTEEEVARRLSISAEMVKTIVNIRLQDQQQIDPNRKITDVGIDEISLKKRHKLYVTILTDLTDPENPQILAVVSGKDQAAGEKALDCLSEEQRAGVRVHRTDMSPAYTAACKNKLPSSQQIIDRFHVMMKLGKALDNFRKTKTRAYKKKLTVKQRKLFRSGLWAFREPYEELTEEQRQELATLFEKLPELEVAYYFRFEIQGIFDTSPNRAKAKARLEEVRESIQEIEDEDLLAAMMGFFKTYDAHQDGILAYFDNRKTSGPVEGINNKARVITKRCYGVKKAKTLWKHLCLNINLASMVVTRTLQDIKQLTRRIRSKFLAYYT